MPDLEEMADFDVLQRFRALSPDLKLEQLMMTAISASRTARSTASDIGEVRELQKTQNGRVGTLEKRQIQMLAVLGFLMVTVPVAISAAALLK